MEKLQRYFDAIEAELSKIEYAATYFIALFPVNKSSGTILPKAKFNHATFCRPGILAIFETRKQL